MHARLADKAVRTPAHLTGTNANRSAVLKEKGFRSINGRGSNGMLDSAVMMWVDHAHYESFLFRGQAIIHHCAGDGCHTVLLAWDSRSL